MTSNELRQKFIDFFKAKGHNQIPSASLIPENDPSVLFTTAGMHPLVPFLLGEGHPSGKRLVGYQKCLRTGDIDEVGDDSHLTFFEMLGNWSLGDYWKKESIEWSWEFLTDSKWLSLSPDKLAVSVFKGDNDSPFDQETYDCWKKMGLPDEKIAKLGKDDNWWPTGGESLGPQGPDTEIFYWTGEESAPSVFDPKDSRWLEIWNNVFMAYNKEDEYQYSPLSQKNVDTGMGLERTLAALNGLQNVYEIDTLKPILTKLKNLAEPGQNEKSLKIIADHLRAAIFIIADGVVPSNVKQGYVLRRLLRRVLRYGTELKFPSNFLTGLVLEIINTQKEAYPELGENQAMIIDEIEKEKNNFSRALENGLKEFKKLSFDKIISGEQAFNLYSTYGFPIEMIKELAEENDLELNLDEFNDYCLQHQKLSQTASAGQFKGGLKGQSEMMTKYHTVTHLLHAALRQALGESVAQKGSNITDERLRFDFSYPEKLTKEQIKKVEDLINEKINENLPITYEEMTLAEAKKSGAIGLFAEKYGEKVKVYTINNPSAGSGQAFSKEICGGPHVENTSILGHFKIIKEEASSKGIRRIKAVLE